ncbi:MAG: phosphoribosylformylglycinamidine synthase subunit PurS [Candidatus Altiarchaeota archaeon]
MAEHQIEVRITLKKGMADAEGESVKKALVLLGYPIEKVETVKTYVLTVKADKKEKALKDAENACRKLLANPVIQDYTLKVL